MYTLIYHKNFEYNLTYEEENLINELLNQNISKKPIINLQFDQLFIDYLYIKYLTIYYNLKNVSQKIFNLTYKLIEDKIENKIEDKIENKIEIQKGGYYISNNKDFITYENKYTFTYLEKQLFLLHLNCLTKVYLYENNP
jgi:predicted transcriptional regulator